MPKKILAGLLAALTLCVPMLALAHGISEADQQRMLDGGYLMYVMLGATHMLTGYDHLLFLFGVVFFLTGFKDIAKFVTVFTLGHCITLIFATYLQITWNFYLVDAAIALSVIYKGFDNNGGFPEVLRHEVAKFAGRGFRVWPVARLRAVHAPAAVTAGR